MAALNRPVFLSGKIYTFQEWLGHAFGAVAALIIVIACGLVIAVSFLFGVQLASAFIPSACSVLS
jgi:hypothetical protein